MNFYRFQILKDGKPVWAAEDFSYRELTKRVLRAALEEISRRWLT